MEFRTNKQARVFLRSRDWGIATRIEERTWVRAYLHGETAQFAWSGGPLTESVVMYLFERDGTASSAAVTWVLRDLLVAMRDHDAYTLPVTPNCKTLVPSPPQQRDEDTQRDGLGFQGLSAWLDTPPRTGIGYMSVPTYRGQTASPVIQCPHIDHTADPDLALVSEYAGRGATHSPCVGQAWAAPTGRLYIVAYVPHSGVITLSRYPPLLDVQLVRSDTYNTADYRATVCYHESDVAAFLDYSLNDAYRTPFSREHWTVTRIDEATRKLTIVCTVHASRGLDSGTARLTSPRDYDTQVFRYGPHDTLPITGGMWYGPLSNDTSERHRGTVYRVVSTNHATREVTISNEHHVRAGAAGQRNTLLFGSPVVWDEAQQATAASPAPPLSPFDLARAADEAERALLRERSHTAPLDPRRRR